MAVALVTITTVAVPEEELPTDWIESIGEDVGEDAGGDEGEDELLELVGGTTTVVEVAVGLVTTITTAVPVYADPVD